MNIPIGTRLGVAPSLLAQILAGFTGKPPPIRTGSVVYREIGERSKLPLYTLAFDDGSTDCYFESQMIIPETCVCGTQMDEVCFIDGTDNCLACHELHVMEQTGAGVVFSPAHKRRAFNLVRPEK